MKWYLIVFTRETPVDLAAIHVPGLVEWLEPQYDKKLHQYAQGDWHPKNVFWTLVRHWWAQGRGKNGGNQPFDIRREPSSIGTVLHDGLVDLMEMDMELVPEHKVPQIDAYRSDESGKVRLRVWEPREDETQGRWLGIHAMQECDGFAEAIQEMDKMRAECADAIDLQNMMRVKSKEALLHQWYDELREYVRREHGKEMPPAHRKDSEVAKPAAQAVA